jgi:tripartite-type tricarboxylate transporter receptor subunit TctC
MAPAGLVQSRTSLSRCSSRWPAASTSLLSGEIAVGFVNITAQVVALHRGGKIRIPAVNAPARLEAVPDIPTTAEAGLPNFVSQTFFGLFAAAGTPKAVLEKVNQVTQSSWSDIEFQKRLIESGFEPMLGLGPDQAALYLSEEIARWTPLIQAIGIQTQP